MKKTGALLATVSLVAFLVSGCSGNGSSLNLESGPVQQINDTVNEEEFAYATVSEVDVVLDLENTNGNAISNATVSAITEGSGEIGSGISDTNGHVDFTVGVPADEESLTLVISHPDYDDSSIVVDDVQQLSSIDREVRIEESSETEVVVDSDGDGIDDSRDAYPEDAAYATSAYGEYVIAYEDLYPNRGDADFNDLVVALQIEEFINSENRVVKIEIRTKVLASGAGYDNGLGIVVAGEEYRLIESAKDELMGHWNSRASDVPYEAQWREIVIEYDEPLQRSEVAAMPYDPYAIVNGDESKQVHLPFVETGYEGQVLDDQGFPWAVLVPVTWSWPMEGHTIFQAYAGFEAWFTSGGEEEKDWFKYPEEGHFFFVE